jgi:hypothetical protein
MQSINKLGLKVVGITALVMLVLFGIYLGARSLIPQSGNNHQDPAPTSPLPEETTAELADSDGDGLPDAVESIYQTNPNQADTDADGTVDGDEIYLRRDPTIPGPEDFVPVEKANPNALPLDTYTGRYLALLPSDASRDQVLNKEKLSEFVETERGELLPTIEVLQRLPTGQPQDIGAIQTYLEAISSTHNQDISAITNEDIEAAYRLHYSHGQPDLMNALIDKLSKNVETLQTIPSPEETIELHRKLNAASQSLLNNVKLLQNMPNDFVGGLIGAKNIEDLGTIFSEIAAAVQILEEKYSLQ